MKIKQGFTLAETMVTLGIISVIAAVALPAINHLKPNQEMTMLKKVYYLTGRMVNELINDEDYYPDDDTENTSGFSRINTTPEAMYHGTEYKDKTKFCGLFSSRMNVKGEIKCESSITKDSTFKKGQAPIGTGHFTTADGVVWVLPISDFDRGKEGVGKQSIYVDVNGERPGNCFPTEAGCKLPDRFEIKVDRWGKLYIEEPITRKYLSLTDTTKSYTDVKNMKDTTVPPKTDE